jgi:hypothetical protein
MEENPEEIPDQIEQKDYFFMRYTPETSELMKSIALSIEHNSSYKVEYRKRFDTVDTEMVIYKDHGRRIP